MSEYASGINNLEVIEQPALIEVREILEGMSPEQLIEEKDRLLAEMSDREALVHQINDVLDGYGVN